MPAVFYMFYVQIIYHIVTVFHIFHSFNCGEEDDKNVNMSFVKALK